MNLRSRMTTSLAAALGVAAVCTTCPAGVTLTAREVDGNVVISGGGTLDLSGLTLGGNATQRGSLVPGRASVTLGASPAGAEFVQVFRGVTPPAAFGPGRIRIGDAGAGDRSA